MRRLEDFHNWLSDKDAGWWPVLFLRPAKDRDIDTRIVLKLACIFGPLSSLVAFLAIHFAKILPLNPGTVCLYIASCTVGFFILYRITFAHFWNRRARRLRMEHEQLELNGLGKG